MPCAGWSSIRAMRLRRSGGISIGVATAPASAATVTGTRATVSPSGPTARISRLRAAGAGTAAISAVRLTAPGSPRLTAIGRSATSSARTCSGPSSRKASPSRSASAWPWAPRAMPSLSQMLLACSRPGVCPSTSRAAARSTGHGRGCQPGRASSAARALIGRSSTRSSGLGAVSRIRTSRPSRSACCRRSRATAMRSSQCFAAAQPLSTTSSKRAAAAEARGRVQDRAGQGHDQEGRDDEAQQQEPPGRARRGPFRAHQLGQQQERREGDAPRRRRGDAQQEPQGG